MNKNAGFVAKRARAWPVQNQSFTTRANSSRFWLTLLFNLGGFGWLWLAVACSDCSWLTLAAAPLAPSGWLILGG